MSSIHQLHFSSSPINYVRQWLDAIEIDDPETARFLCHAIPAQCPFAQQIKLFGKCLLSIPPLCKLNPFYEQIIALRFRSLCYLVDECGEDVSSYC